MWWYLTKDNLVRYGIREVEREGGREGEREREREGRVC